MLIAFIAAGLAPFGNRNLMAMDAYAQYFPMLREYVRAGSDWSFAGALGFNQLTQSAYYTNSPLWLLLHLVPLKFTIEAVHFIILFRFGLAGLSFTYFIVRYYKSRSKFAFIFAAAYALSAYTLAFINQFMWMDLVVLLPLLAASLWRSWEKDQFIPYILVLATALYTNFYLAYMLCLFAPLWSIHLMFRQKKPRASVGAILSSLPLPADRVRIGCFCSDPYFFEFAKHLGRWIKPSRNPEIISSDPELPATLSSLSKNILGF